MGPPGAEALAPHSSMSLPSSSSPSSSCPSLTYPVCELQARRNEKETCGAALTADSDADTVTIETRGLTML